jgi:hypothetical protein
LKSGQFLRRLDDGHAVVDSDLLTAISTDVDEIIAIVALAVTLDRDPELRIELRRHSRVGESETLSLELPRLSGIMKLLPGGGFMVEHTLEGSGVDFNDLINTHEPMRTAIDRGRLRATAVAMQNVSPFFSPERLPTRAEFAELWRWAPIIEKQAYRICARLIDLMEGLRASALREPKAVEATGNSVERYYGLLHTMAHLTLLASSPGAGPWLRGMAKSFTWVNWTPTFPLVRERTVWVAAAAARSAAVFGADVLPLYFEALTRARHPMQVFDALFGLVAIACAEDRAVEPILEGIAHQQRTMRRHPIVGQQYADIACRTAAEGLLRWTSGLEPPKHILARLGWNATGSTGLATRAALTLDPTDLGKTGRMIGLAALPFVMRSTTLHHFPAHVGPTPPALPRAREMRSMLRRAWSPAVGPDLHSSRTRAN